MKGEKNMMKKNRMKKYIAAAAVSAAVLGALTGCGSGKDIGRDAALEAALNDAGVSESETTRLKVSEDRDDGRKVYEIRFDVAEKEYDYEVLAADGSIISSEIDMNENYRPSSEETGSQGGTAAQDGSADQGASAGADTAQAQNGGQADAGVAVSVDEAIGIALARVEGRRTGISGSSWITMTAATSTKARLFTRWWNMISRLMQIQERFLSGVKNGIKITGNRKDRRAARGGRLSVRSQAAYILLKKPECGRRRTRRLLSWLLSFIILVYR